MSKVFRDVSNVDNYVYGMFSCLKVFETIQLWKYMLLVLVKNRISILYMFIVMFFEHFK